MWPELWVGRETCRHKMNVFNSLRKWREFRPFKSATWILKSPTNVRSTLDKIWNSSKDSNPEKNVDIDDSGRYTIKSLNELFYEVITESKHLNMEKNRRYKRMINRFLVKNSNTTQWCSGKKRSGGTV